VARFEEAIYVLHCFGKKSRKTPKAEIDMGRRRYAAMLEARRART
jgi:phage-related protein